MFLFSEWSDIVLFSVNLFGCSLNLWSDIQLIKCSSISCAVMPSRVAMPIPWREANSVTWSRFRDVMPFPWRKANSVTWCEFRNVLRIPWHDANSMMCCQFRRWSIQSDYDEDAKGVHKRTDRKWNPVRWASFIFFFLKNTDKSKSKLRGKVFFE